MLLTADSEKETEALNENVNEHANDAKGAEGGQKLAKEAQRRRRWRRH